MQARHDIDSYSNTMIEQGLYANKGYLQFNVDTVFRGIDFKNARVLDIGGGSGLYSFYAACRGAKDVVCLEPEGDGSSSGVVEEFKKLIRLLLLENVVLEQVTLQAFDSDGGGFDILLLHNSINHLDQTACINLLKIDASRNVCIELFSKINSLSKKGARLIICDCSKYNLFAHLKIPNPFAPSIEWHKHQAPEVWAHLLGEAGFVNPRVRWLSFNRLRWYGRVLFGNRLTAYFLISQFYLSLDKV